MIPNMVDTVFQDIIPADQKNEDVVVNETNDKKLAELFGCDKSETEDDADEVVIVENVNGL